MARIMILFSTVERHVRDGVQSTERSDRTIVLCLSGTVGPGGCNVVIADIDATLTADATARLLGRGSAWRFIEADTLWRRLSLAWHLPPTRLGGIHGPSSKSVAKIPS